MYDQDQLIEKLGIAGWDAKEQELAIEGAKHRIGLLIDEGLTEQQRNEYTAIIDDDRGVIDAWLEQNVPDYKQSPVFQQFEEGVSEDPEQNSPEKLFASIAWMQFNVSNMQEVIEKALSEHKEEIQSSRGA